MRTIAVLEGWAGGPRLSRNFTTYAHGRGLILSKKPTQADYIVAHSTGCYMLPRQLKAKRIMLIDPPYWPGESIVGRWINMNKGELRVLLQQHGYWRFFRNKFWEIYYIFAKPSYSWSVFRNQSHLDFIDKLAGKKVVLVRNQADEFCSPDIKQALAGHKNFTYVEVPGYHGDYYLNPEPYIDLLLKGI